MKFQKGLLEEFGNNPPASTGALADEPDPVDKPVGSMAPVPAEIKGEHLFETLDVEVKSTRKYTKVFGAVVIFVIGAGIAIGYFLQPGVGDRVRDPGGYEAAIREHFLSKEKRTATDVLFYKCDGFLSAKVGVETRNDLPNPIFKLDTYTARVSRNGDQWSISAAPIPDGEAFLVCK